MAKQKKETVQVEQVEQKTNLYPMEDRLEIMRLFKVANANQTDIDSIFSLYKKYINPNVKSYTTSCNCNGSISHYWKQLTEWYSENNSLFA